LLAALTLTAGCAATEDKPVPLPPVSESQATPPESTKAEEPVAAPTPPSVVVIDEGGESASSPKTLAEAAEAERVRRAQATRPVVVLDDRNLKAHGKDQKLTIAEGAPSENAAGKEALADAAATVRDETYWRDRGLDIRKRWRAAADRVVELQAEAEGLRRRFYSADDPYIRDTQIKPEWDRVLAELDEQRHQAEQGVDELERYLNEGREAGALPGWLRDGSELEPEVRRLKAPTAEPTEPVEATEAPDNP
jgi:chromosome segregation ATPase